MLRIGLVGYGSGGRNFHAPFIEAAEGVELVGVVARAEATKAAVDADFPGLPTYASLTDLLAAGVDAVTITTPPETRRALVLEALAAGVHVVADKPFAPDAAAARELADAADAAGLVLAVYHNRRFDADVRTLAGVLESGALGDLWRVHARFDLDEPGSLDAGPTGGLLRDLGTHLVDQLVWLLGDVASVSAELDLVEQPEGTTDASFHVTLKHTSGVTSYAEASKLNHVERKTYRAYGSLGSYESDGTDVQAAAIFSGRRPVDDREGWGYEAEERWGVLATEAGRVPAPSAKGDYAEFYERFAAAVAGEGDSPSPASDGVRTLAVLDAARRSGLDGGSWQTVG